MKIIMLAAWDFIRYAAIAVGIIFLISTTQGCGSSKWYAKRSTSGCQSSSGFAGY